TPGWQGTNFPETSSSNIYYPHSSAQNYTGIDLDDEVADDVNTMKSETDEAVRLEATNRFSKAVAETFSTIPLYATPNIFAVKEGIASYGASLFEAFAWTQVGYAKECPPPELTELSGEDGAPPRCSAAGPRRASAGRHGCGTVTIYLERTTSTSRSSIEAPTAPSTSMFRRRLTAAPSALCALPDRFCHASTTAALGLERWSRTRRSDQEGAERAVAPGERLAPRAANRSTGLSLPTPGAFHAVITSGSPPSTRGGRTIRSIAPRRTSSMSVSGTTLGTRPVRISSCSECTTTRGLHSSAHTTVLATSGRTSNLQPCTPSAQKDSTIVAAQNAQTSRHSTRPPTGRMCVDPSPRRALPSRLTAFRRSPRSGRPSLPRSSRRVRRGPGGSARGCARSAGQGSAPRRGAHVCSRAGGRRRRPWSVPTPRCGPCTSPRCGPRCCAPPTDRGRRRGS